MKKNRSSEEKKEDNTDKVEVKKISYSEGSIYTDGTYLFYLDGECQGKRSDGSIGMIEVVHLFNFKTKADSVLFNIDYDAGWAC